MDSLTLFVLICTGILILLVKYIEYTRDVPPLYLSEQSIIDDGRLPNESAIYKSNKLDYGKGLRIGLDIRYDSYKLRHGNLRDIYEILIKHNRTSTRSIIVNDSEISVLQLNFRVNEISNRLRQSKVTSIKIDFQSFLKDANILALLIAGFINQIPVEIYQHKSLLANDDEVPLFAEDFDFSSILMTETLSTFNNNYSAEDDKGIALRVLRKLKHQVESQVEFTQLNLVSAVASTLRHLPLSQQISKNDTMLIVKSIEDMSNEELLNILTKVLASFITNCNLVITEDSSFSSLQKYHPTILSVNQLNLTKFVPTKELSTFQYLIKLFNLFNMNKGKFLSTRCFPSSLRLIYSNKTISEPRVPLREVLAMLGSRIIVESGYYNIVGPILVNDFYDYRKISASYKSHGCICQSLELKLNNYEQNKGYLMARGYTIGKTTNSLNGKVAEVQSKNDGFMPLLNVNGSWGNDGCLYVQ